MPRFRPTVPATFRNRKPARLGMIVNHPHRGEGDAESLVDERRQPGQQHVERPVVAEVRDDHCPHRRLGQQPRHGGDWVRRPSSVARISASSVAPMVRSSAGDAVTLSAHGTAQIQSEHSEQIEGPGPAHLLDDDRRHHQREHGAERNAAGVERDGAGALGRAAPSARSCCRPKETRRPRRGRARPARAGVPRTRATPPAA